MGLKEHIAVLVKTENIEEAKDYLLGLGIKFDRTTCEQDSNLTPVLGAHVPSAWLQHLDQSIDNIYRPEEWVVYEEEGVMILVRILCPILHDLEGDGHLPRMYVVWITLHENLDLQYIYTVQMWCKCVSKYCTCDISNIVNESFIFTMVLMSHIPGI